MSIETRLARLESQNRWLRGGFALAMLAAVVPLVMGSEKITQDLIRAKQFQLVDEDGDIVGVWDFDSDKRANSLLIGTGTKGEPYARIEITKEVAACLVHGGRDEGGAALMHAFPDASEIKVYDGHFFAKKKDKTVFVAPN